MGETMTEETTVSEPMTDDDLERIERHAEYGHFEGQDYDAVETLVAEVRRLREERRGMVAESSWDELADEMTEVEAEVRRLRDVLHDLDDFTARHRGPSRFDHDHDCREAWMLLHDEVRTLIGDDDD